MSEPIPISPSNIRDLSCGHKFQELRILKHWGKQRTKSTYLMHGTAAHAVFAELFNPKYGNCPPHLDRLEVALRRAVASEPYPDEIAKAMASGWISSLVKPYLDFWEPDRKVLAVEQDFDFPLHCRAGTVSLQPFHVREA